MSKHFFRKVAFGLNGIEKVPDNPLMWAKAQIQKLPETSWNGPLFSDEMEGVKKAGELSVERQKIQKKNKKNKDKQRKLIGELNVKTGLDFYENAELSARHHACLHDNSPVFQRFVMFWGNHFALSKRFFLAEFTSGAYHRTVLQPHMIGNFTDLVEAATKSWSMIELLDNQYSTGPNSKWGKNNRTDSINENHGRELLELHTVSPSIGYTQDDVVEITLAMTGWGKSQKPKSMGRFTPVKFIKERHEPGDRIILGKTYKASVNGGQLRKIIEDLSSNDHTLRYISKKLCRHFITDEPNDEMVQHVVKAWQTSQGQMIAIHEAVLEMAYKHAGTSHKFQQPEYWFLQVAKMSGANWPVKADELLKYDFTKEPSSTLTAPRDMLIELGQRPFQPSQPDGFADNEESWVSPEYLIRRVGIVPQLLRRSRRKKNRTEATITSAEMLNNVIMRNFDNDAEVISFLEAYPEKDRLSVFLASKWVLKV